jgi:hypothetical protein
MYICMYVKILPVLPDTGPSGSGSMLEIRGMGFVQVCSTTCVYAHIHVQ